MDFRMQTCSHYKVLCAIPDSIFRPFIWPTLRKIEKCLILTIVLLFSELNPIESDCFSGKNMDFGFIFDQARWTNRSNRPWIRPGTVKSLNAPWELSQLALRRDYSKKIDPFRMIVWLGQRTVPQCRVSTRCYLAGRYKLGRSC